jgi:peroxiredoxin
MRTIIIFFFALLVAYGCSKKAGYTVEGTLTGINSGKVLIQEYLGQSKYKNVDSAEISGGKFILEGTVDYPRSVIVGVDGKRSKTSFWLENSRISFIANVDSMFKAKVSGSKANDEYLAYNKYLEPYREGSRNLYSALNEIKQSGSEEEINSAQVIADSAKKSEINAVIEYIRLHPDSYVGASILKSAAYYLTWQELDEAIKLLEPQVAETDLIVELKEKVEVLKTVDIGQKAPDFTMNDPDGIPIRLYDVLSDCKVLLLDFWAAWCGPCRRENPFVVDTYNHYHADGFTVLGVSLDRDRESWVKAIDDDNLTWTHISNLKYWDNPVAKIYGVSAIPTNYLIDHDGIILGKNLRGIALKEKVRSVLGVQ